MLADFIIHFLSRNNISSGPPGRVGGCSRFPGRVGPLPTPGAAASAPLSGSHVPACRPPGALGPAWTASGTTSLNFSLLITVSGCFRRPRPVPPRDSNLSLPPSVLGFPVPHIVLAEVTRTPLPHFPARQVLALSCCLELHLLWKALPHPPAGSDHFFPPVAL